MTALFYIAVVVSLAAVGVMIYAVATAEDGYEDEEGFHSLESRKTEQASQADGEDSVPPLLHVR